ncbi:hypothetical protein PHAVU_002G296900 [Phaseolus vulgaris]|uniref:Uncharacterized protein n=1 Tax=Phaseolus vulgaris TaxID=3885 RepID=V7CPW5_PHAVU|nr:hypothetical protein PHAVU_002G296900g [Phaseolus vulgaris]ESW32144.1 hypothetical protein PHAVU_002G296900g [Phaseolus vulgaris]
MEKKSREEKLNPNQVSKGNVWDCGSSLYDSFELNSLKRQLNTAIANSPKNRRTLSMSHLPERCLSLQLHPQPPIMSNNKPFKISRTFHRLLRFVFKSSNKLRTSSSCSRATTPNNTTFQVAERYSNKDRFYVVYDKSEPVLSTIPELPEFEVGVLSPEIASFVRKTASERFMATTAIGISCA